MGLILRSPDILLRLGQSLFMPVILRKIITRTLFHSQRPSSSNDELHSCLSRAPKLEGAESMN